MTYSPPKSCIPSRANMRMKRKSRNSRETMERMEFRSDTTRLRREAQYLSIKSISQLILTAKSSERHINLKNKSIGMNSVFCTSI